MGSPAPPSLRILCFGASITGGVHTYGLAKHPYALRLKTNLQQALPSTELDISVDSVSGDVVVGGSYIQRLEARIASPRTKYDWIVIQGGGNDLGRGEDPQTVFENLKKVWGMAMASGVRVLALTVTETSSPSFQVRAKYDSLNGMILQHRANLFHVCDVSKQIPYHSMTSEEKTKFWFDGLHFKKAGYDLMGDVVADRLKEIFLESPPSKI